VSTLVRDLSRHGAAMIVGGIVIGIHHIIIIDGRVIRRGGLSVSGEVCFGGHNTTVNRTAGCSRFAIAPNTRVHPLIHY